MILCCGESLIDMLPRSLPSGEDVFLPVAGGAVFNTAIALGRLGEETAFFCGLSTDMFGDLLVRTLEESRVSHSLCPRLDRPTTLAFVTLVNGHAKYAFYDENTALRMLTPADLPEPGHVIAAQFGAISLIGEPCGTAFEALCMRLREKSVISLDPNVRPGFVRDAASYRARLERMLAVADIIKVSDEDLAWLAPGRDFAAMAKEWMERGASIVVQTLGERGAVAYTATQRIEVGAPKTVAADTVGAGDTFNAGLLSGLNRAGVLDKQKLKSASVEVVAAALDLAARAAAVTVSRAGANPPWLSELG
jgi:fructokinase